jgi:hypothetical protein
MKTIITYSLVIVALFGCKEKSSSKNGDLENKIPENESQQIQKSEIENTLFDIEKLPSAIQEELQSEMWLGNIGNSSIKKIIQKNDGIIISEYENGGDISKNIIVTSNYLILSYSVGVGEEKTLIYNKKTKKHSIIDDFAEDLIGNNSIKVTRDYYDSRDVNDPNYEGHIFEEGEYNLSNNIYKKL